MHDFFRGKGVKRFEEKKPHFYFEIFEGGVNEYEFVIYFLELFYFPNKEFKYSIDIKKAFEKSHEENPIFSCLTFV